MASTTKQFIGRQGMSAIDIATFCYGDASKLFQLRKENPGFNFNLADYTGIKINFTPNNNSNSLKQKFTNTIPATAAIQTRYLLQEDGFDFLLEDGTGKIELEQ